MFYLTLKIQFAGSLADLWSWIMFLLHHIPHDFPSWGWVGCFRAMGTSLLGQNIKLLFLSCSGCRCLGFLWIKLPAGFLSKANAGLVSGLFILGSQNNVYVCIKHRISWRVWKYVKCKDICIILAQFKKYVFSSITQTISRLGNSVI